MKKLGKAAVLGLLGAVLLCFPVFADRLGEDKNPPTDLVLHEDGYATWTAPAESVKKYTAELQRLKNGSTWVDYQTRTTEEESCEFSISRTGYYRFKVRAHYYDDTYSKWAEFPEGKKVLIDEENTSSGGSGGVPDDWGWVYSPGPGYDQNGVPLTPGSAKPIPNYNSGYQNGYSQSTPGYPNNNNYNSGYPAATSNTGWVKGEKGWWYKYSNGSYPRSTWERISEKWYYFDAAGYMQTGWIWYQNNWYLCLPDGQVATGWRNVNERWYYLNPSGIMLTGYQLIDGKMYYLDATGARVQNGYSPDGHQFDENGVMIA